MATNTLRPTLLRTGTPTVVSTAGTNTTVNQQTVYEWQDFSSQWKTNPQFLKGSAGSLMEGLHVTGGEERPRILRGYIRRAEYALNDDASMSRLYFMYNPEQISRDYVNYLDQGALDPFNTVFQSNNLVAPPSILNFSFELFFDRQEEAMEVGNRGVMVDMDYFDLVVRNVKPNTGSTNNSLPDNGIMMVNPRDITVVFSPEITVQGRPLNASVTYERFTYKMVPTRMRINLQMRVVYFGPQKDITTFVPETVRALESIPFPIKEPARYEFIFEKLEFQASNEHFGPNVPLSGGDGGGGADETAGETGERSPNGLFGDIPAADIPTGAEAGYVKLNMEAAAHAHQKAKEFNTQYADANHNRMDLWKQADCSSFVWAGFAELGLSASLGWQKWGSGWCVNTAGMYDSFASSDKHGRRLWGFSEGGLNSGQFAKAFATMTAGDILLRHKAPGHKVGHVAYVWEVDKTAKTIKYLHSASNPLDVTIGTLSSSNNGNFNYGIRPYPSK